ncbi:MAG TPA: nitrogenase cofactor biosynthesis protein NifB [Candidatus Competibacteraceae bacterium]|nr:nitrogenase cofactor biosynthesis protein NifB [Candidatus Competibacteraceae bacterium]MCP5134306.1 nitrogenase cofactor biosynthesis protein NifB [Gammaproteobacteria bacterium]HPF58207.1 nitrogenase cofactor biosynthesis protein NifB [Candidatus Competibacteraceae bacterium]HRY17127.1 nitrogenase cofactor biosynthesis protein NifB [Candidatus Competibacteraceae bacterium]
MEPMHQQSAIGATPALHPCYSPEAHRHFARLHLAVAPKCNIQCHYCNRKYHCSNESRPGVVAELLSPEQAVKKALAVGAVIPHLAVVGIAGPGDPLANPEPVFATLGELHAQAPDLLLCLSTNGLALPEHADALAGHGIHHVTITINCVDPEIGAQIYPWIVWQGQRVRGKEAAKILIEQQLRGLALLTKRGVQVKINSVLIPGINDAHLPEVNRIVREKGAILHNIMPLIARAEHGTYFGIMGQREPHAGELAAVRDACESNAGMMSHCQQCRADATGMLNEDRGGEFSMAKVEAMTIDPQEAMAKREAVRAAIVRRLEKTPPTAARSVVVSMRPQAAREILRIAVGSLNGRTIDAHFGHLRELLIYDVSTGDVHLIERREIARYCHGATTCGDSDAALEGAIRALHDCALLLCSRVGFTPWRALENAGIEPNSEHGGEPIDDALHAVYAEWRTSGRLAIAPNRIQSISA